jgi:hypothetical protein
VEQWSRLGVIVKDESTGKCIERERSL